MAAVDVKLLFKTQLYFQAYNKVYFHPIQTNKPRHFKEYSHLQKMSNFHNS